MGSLTGSIRGSGWITGGSLLCRMLLLRGSVGWAKCSLETDNCGFLRCKGGGYGSAVLYWEDESEGVGEGRAGKWFRNG
jgi:hypothetical protein